jgi:hypothetical protein
MGGVQCDMFDLVLLTKLQLVKFGLYWSDAKKLYFEVTQPDPSFLPPQLHV